MILLLPLTIIHYPQYKDVAIDYPFPHTTNTSATIWSVLEGDSSQSFLLVDKMNWQQLTEKSFQIIDWGFDIIIAHRQYSNRTLHNHDLFRHFFASRRHTQVWDPRPIQFISILTLQCFSSLQKLGSVEQGNPCPWFSSWALQNYSPSCFIRFMCKKSYEGIRWPLLYQRRCWFHSELTFLR